MLVLLFRIFYCQLTLSRSDLEYWRKHQLVYSKNTKLMLIIKKWLYSIYFLCMTSLLTITLHINCGEWFPIGCLPFLSSLTAIKYLLLRSTYADAVWTYPQWDTSIMCRTLVTLKFFTGFALVLSSDSGY